MNIKKRLYVYVAIVFAIGMIVGYLVDFAHINMMFISAIAVFVMLYPMLTGMEIEKVRNAGHNFKLIITTLIFSYFIASVTAFIISRTILIGYNDLALAIVLVGAIPCSNMLIGWSGIADASVPDALVIAVIGLILIPIISPVLISMNGDVFVKVNTMKIAIILLIYIMAPMIFGLITRKAIIKKKGKNYFMANKKYLPGISAIGVLIIVFFSVAKVARIVIFHPEIFLLVITGLFTYYMIQTLLSALTAKILRFKYPQAMVLILGATASSQAISLSLAAAVFPALTVFALSFKPILQVLYILILIYAMGPWLKRIL